MRGISVICSVLVIGISVFAQPLPMEVQWFNQYGPQGPGFDAGRAMTETPEGDIVVGGTVGTPEGWLITYNPYVVKTSAYGDSIWALEYNYPNYSCDCNGVVMTGDGGYTFAFLHSVSSPPDMYSIEFADSLGNIQYSIQHSVDSYITINDFIYTSDGGYVIFGATDGINDGDIYMIKLDSAGEIEWENTFHNSGYDGAYAGIELSDGGFLIAGYTISLQGLAMKLDSYGELIWQIEKSEYASSQLFDVVELADGNYVFGGDWHDEAGEHPYLFSVNPQGDIIWEFLGEDSGMPFQHITEDQDEGLICSYSAYLPIGTDYNFCYVKTDKYGRIIYHYEYDTECYDWVVAMMMTADNCLAATGRYCDEAPHEQIDDIFVIKTGPVPTVITVELPDTTVNTGESVWIPVTCSNISEEDSVLSFQMIINYDAEIGYIDSAKIAGSLTPDHFTSVWNFSQPGIVNGGYLNFSNLEGITGSGMLCYLRFTGDNAAGGSTELEFEACIFNGGEPSSSLYNGSVTVAGVGVGDSGTDELPAGFNFHPVYPNPFNSEFFLEYELPASGYAEISVYDISGRLVTNLFSGQLEAGYYRKSYSFDSFASGIYFFKLRAGEFTYVQKAVYIK